MSKQAKAVFTAMLREPAGDLCMKCRGWPAYNYKGANFIVLKNSYCSDDCLLAYLATYHGDGMYYVRADGLVDRRHS